jgi:tRNA (guanine37-N1)-methyltransferase
MRIAYDVIGSKDRAVALIGSDVKNPRKFAKEIMKRHKNVKSVLQKKSQRKDTFRLYSCKLIVGDKNTKVVHRENGYSVLVDPQKVYFSQREATERQRIADSVKPNERILIMFSGAGPYALAIAKKCKGCQLVCVEINPSGFEYSERSAKLNKLRNIKNICADIRKVRNIGSFDRILMPLPETALDFLDEAYLHSKKGTIVHLYAFSSESENYKDIEAKVDEFAKAHNIRYEIMTRQKVLPYAPRIAKVRLDIKIVS